MKTKTKYILAISLVSLISIALVIGIIAVVASLKTIASGTFKISYVAQNVNAKVGAKYAITDNPDTMPTWTTIMSNGSEFITFNANDTTDEVTKSFDGIEAEILHNQYLYFKYTFTHTGTETNSAKFLNISLTPTFTAFTNMTMEYGTVGTDGALYWTNDLSELVAVRGESATVDMYIRFYITTKTINADLEGDFIWELTGSDEYMYDTSYLAVGDMKSALGNVSPTSIVFDNSTSSASLEQGESGTTSLAYENTPLAKATTYIPLNINGSYGISAYMEGTTLYISSPYKINAVSCNNLISNLTTNPTSVTAITFTNFDTSNVIDMSNMFNGCSGLTLLNLNNFNTSKVKDMTSMFNGCTVLSKILVSSSWTTANVISSTNMFLNCTSLVGGSGKEYNNSHLDVTYAQSGSGYFSELKATLINAIKFSDYASSATSITFDYYNAQYNSIISGVTPTAIDEDSAGDINMYIVGTDVYVLSEGEIYANISCGDMFNNITSLTSIKFNNFNTNNVTNMSSMFYGCSKLTSLELSGWNTSNVTTMLSMFCGCSG